MASMMDLRRNIALNEPHVVDDVQATNIATFTTDIKAPIKSIKTYFNPIQAGSGTPSPDNVRSISGWNGMTVRKAGKNIVNIVGFSAKNTTSPSATRSATNNYGTTISTTEPVSSLMITQSEAPYDQDYASYHNGYFTIIDDNLEYDQTYRVSFMVTDIISNPLGANLNNWRIFNPRGFIGAPIVYGNKVSCSLKYTRNSSGSPNRHGIEVRNCGMSCTISEIMVTPVADEDITYKSPSLLEIPISFPQTIYGGYVDLVKGEVVEEWAKVTSPKWSQCLYGADLGNNTRKTFNVSRAMPGNSYSLCDNAEYLQSNTSDTVHYYINSKGNAVYLVLPNDTADDYTVDIAYKLSTPNTYTLTPQTLKALKGINNIWSDANGKIDVKYWKH